MPSNIQVHRQVPLNNANIPKETKLALHKLLKKFDSIISKSENDIGQMDLIEMHITMSPDSSPAAARPYPLALKHHDFLKQEIKKIIRCRNHPQEHVSLGTSYHICQKHTPEDSPQQFRLCIIYRNLNSLLPSVTPATGTKKGAFTLMPLPKIEELFALLKESKVLYNP